jgi:prolyl-tRNA synthetase
LIEATLAEIQQGLFDRALKFRNDHTQTVSDYAELKAAVEIGFALCYWDGDADDEQKIQDELKATVRVIPFDQPEKSGKCVLTGRETSQQVIIARSY